MTAKGAFGVQIFCWMKATLGSEFVEISEARKSLAQIEQLLPGMEKVTPGYWFVM